MFGFGRKKTAAPSSMMQELAMRAMPAGGAMGPMVPNPMGVPSFESGPGGMTPIGGYEQPTHTNVLTPEQIENDRRRRASEAEGWGWGGRRPGQSWPPMAPPPMGVPASGMGDYGKNTTGIPVDKSKDSGLGGVQMGQGAGSMLDVSGLDPQNPNIIYGRKKYQEFF